MFFFTFKHERFAVESIDVSIFLSLQPLNLLFQPIDTAGHLGLV